MKYDGKFGTNDDENKASLLNELFLTTSNPDIDNPDESFDTPILIIDLNELDKRTQERARIITERLADYYFDQKYIDNHPYIKNKIAQEMDNIRRLLKMLSVNEKAQDTLITSITTNTGKGTLYGSLTSLQNSMLSMQAQLNTLTSNLEGIFREMQANCEQTYEEKDKEVNVDGSMTVRGSRDFIKDINKMLIGDEIEYNIDTEA